MWLRNISWLSEGKVCSCIFLNWVRTILHAGVVECSMRDLSLVLHHWCRVFVQFRSRWSESFKLCGARQLWRWVCWLGRMCCNVWIYRWVTLCVCVCHSLCVCESGWSLCRRCTVAVTSLYTTCQNNFFWLLLFLYLLVSWAWWDWPLT